MVLQPLSLCVFLLLLFCFFFFGWFSCGTLVPQAGIQLEPPALGAWSLTHWITREVPVTIFYEPMLVSQFNIQREMFLFHEVENRNRTENVIEEKVIQNSIIHGYSC